MTMRRSTLLLLAAAALPLAGCISFGAEPPPSLLTVDATAQPQPGQAQTSAAAKSMASDSATRGQIQ